MGEACTGSMAAHGQYPRPDCFGLRSAPAYDNTLAVLKALDSLLGDGTLTHAMLGNDPETGKLLDSRVGKILYDRVL